MLYEIAYMLCGEDSLSIDELINGEKGLRRIYNLSSVAANDYLDKLDASGYIKVDRTAGLDVIYPIKELDSDVILKEYYESK